jgi:hypothetical protein
MNNGRFPRSSQEAFGIRLKSEDFEEEKSSSFYVICISILLISIVLFFK